MAKTKSAKRIFISYSHDNRKQKQKLLVALTPLQRKGTIEIWHDGEILPGTRFTPEIAERLRQSDVAIFLVSLELLGSSYVSAHELPQALAQEQTGQTRIVPILISACRWQDSDFASLHMLPQGGKSIASWKPQAEAWTKVVEEITRLVTSADADARPAAPAPIMKEPSLKKYLSWVETECRYIDPRNLGMTIVEKIPLDDVYMTLESAAPDAQREALGQLATQAQMAHSRSRSEKPRKPPSLLALAAKTQHAVLVGDPGSGKSTFLRYLAQLLARSGAGDSKALAKLKLKDPLPIPLIVKLQEFSTWLVDPERGKDAKLPDTAPEHLYRYCNFLARGHAHRLPDDYFGNRIQRGGCYLLLDGLDEVPGDDLRQRIRIIVEQVIEETSDASVPNRSLVTCRDRSYRGVTQLLGTPIFHIRPLDDGEIKRFAENWSRLVHGANRGRSAALAKAREHSDDLLKAIKGNKAVLKLAQSPLLLTMLAVLHQNHRELPQERSALYSLAVDYLLKSRQAQSTQTKQRREEGLRRIALQMSIRAKGVQKQISRDDAAELAEAVLGCDRGEAKAFVESEELISGLLVCRREPLVEFSHLTFQEYLAAKELAEMDKADRWALIRERVLEPDWAEIVNLLGGCLGAATISKAQDLITKLLESQGASDRRALAVVTTGRIVRDLKPYEPNPAHGTPFKSLLSDAAADFEDGSTQLDEGARVELGDLLATELECDPRLVDPSKNRVLIKGDTFLMGVQSTAPNKPGYEPDAFLWAAPVHEAVVDDFLISRYPVTVTEFAAFIQDGGYQQKAHWTPQGWRWVKHDSVAMPIDWQRQRRYGTRPVVGVSWFEADAYARWAGGRLPTEAQWERTARGSAGRKYPWGFEEPASVHANFGMRVGRPSPVGVYPHGRTPEGVYDLAGNVWEWCHDWFGDYSTKTPRESEGPGSGSVRVLRGGAFGSDPYWLRSASRDSLHHSYRLIDLGFRVVWLSSGGHARP